MNRRATPAQRGFGLVESMVAAAVGLLLLAGLAQILLGDKDSFQVQQRQAALQQNGRLASFLIESTVGVAGYRSDPLQDESDVFKPHPAIGGTEGGTADTLRVRFQAQGGLRDCLGDEVVAPGSPKRPQTADFEYSLAKGTLRCQDFTGGAPPQPLISGVEALELQYGVDTDGDDSVNEYVNADAVGNFSKVLSVHVQLLLASDGDVRPRAASQTFATIDGDIATFDRRQRLLVDRVVALRNRLR